MRYRDQWRNMLNGFAWVVVGLFFFQYSALAAVPEIEREALVALYDSTNGPEWRSSKNWLIGDPCGGNWYGIVCGKDGNITEIDMKRNRLNGTIPAELGNLASLESLELRVNELSGTIPLELGSQTNLRELILEKNQLSGVIPSTLGKLLGLELISLRNNKLRGSIPPEFGNLLNLRSLTLGSNQLNGSIPAELGKLANLQQLGLLRNSLSGSLPAELGNMINLESLTLGLNNLSGSMPSSFGNLTSLQNLDLEHNQLTGSIPATLGNLFMLKALQLDDNQLSGSIPATLGNLTKLERLFLRNNQLSGPIPAEFRNLATLWSLQLKNNRLNGSIPTSLSSLPRLREVDLGYNQLSGLIPTGFGNQSGLRKLNLRHNLLTGSIPAGLNTLYALSLQHNQLTGPIPAELGNSSGLDWLWLGSNLLSGPIPESFASFSGRAGSLSLDWNTLFTDDAYLDAVLDVKSESDWSSTQTIAPGNISVSSVATDSVTLAWESIEYTENNGGYRVWYGTTPGGSYLDGGITVSKSSTAHTVTGLNPGQDYYFVVTTETNSHSDNKNSVISEASDEVFASTSSANLTGIKATDGTFVTHVQVTFNLVADATVYRVFRCLDMDQTCGTPIGYPTTGSFEDRNVVPGTVYYYRVKACIVNICGKLSPANTGFASVQLPQPTGVNATDGLYVDRVHISWNGVDGASVYRVFRCLDTDQTCGSAIGFPQGISFYDKLGAAGTVYQYRVKACNTQHCSKFSVANAGHRSDTPALKKDETNTFLLPDQEVPIPTLSTWGRWLLMLMILGVGLVLLNRQYQQNPEKGG